MSPAFAKATAGGESRCRPKGLWQTEREHRFGGSSEVVTPVPIPNTVVKHFSADGTLQKGE